MGNKSQPTTTTSWSVAAVGNQTGRTAIVTGANSGLGFETALALASTGMRVVLACRNANNASDARRRILAQHPRSTVDIGLIDTGSLASVRAFAEQFQAQHQRLDLLINNAGIMVTPYQRTVDGFESQLAVNYLGHFLLTGLLLPLLNPTPGARVVTLYSLAHRWGGIQFDDMHFEKKYDGGKAYYQSKMACLMFALELDQRLKAAGQTTRSIAAHPGMSQSNLSRYLPLPLRLITSLISPLLLQPAAMGAYPTLYAALADGLTGGETIGPGGAGQRKGYPAVVDVEPAAHDNGQRQRLWTISEQLVGFRFPG